MTGEELRYESATFVRPALGKPGKADLRVFLRNGQAPNVAAFNFAIIAQLHQFDWSGETGSPSGRAEATEITGIVSHELQQFGWARAETEAPSKIQLELASVYKTANAHAQELKVTASLLTALWKDRKLYIASIGGCQASLLRNEDFRQLIDDDYLRIEVNGVADTRTNFLTKVLGSSEAHGTADLHFQTCNVEPGDVALLYNDTFHRQVSERELVEAHASVPKLQEFVSMLGEKTAKNANALEAVLLCAVKFK